MSFFRKSFGFTTELLCFSTEGGLSGGCGFITTTATPRFEKKQESWAFLRSWSDLTKRQRPTFLAVFVKGMGCLFDMIFVA
jgi:hypothetical protein